MKKIGGDAKSIRSLLAGAKYTIDYYQRDYRWQTKHVDELLEDLAGKFLESYEPGHERSAVERYGHYFLGSIIISDKDGQKFIIDGQQRLTTLTLLLIYLQRMLTDPVHKGQISDLIFAQKFGKKSFNLEVPDRTPCMEALYNGTPFDERDHNESIRNILGRYHDIEDRFPEDLREASLPFFADWLIENVHMVEITAYSDEDAYTIFETMNDRGLSLTPTDMLKGYLLANIDDKALRDRTSRTWKDRVKALVDLGKEEDSDCIKSWLRSQYAETIRERKAGAVPKDFDQIGTEFHRWVRDREDSLGLSNTDSFARFIEKDFNYYSRWYARLRTAGEQLTPGLEAVFYNAEHRFTLQYPVLLAPLKVDEPEDGALHKIRVVAAFIDILIARRIWNSRAMDYSTMQYAMFLVMRDIRGMDRDALAAVLAKRLDEEPETFSSSDKFRLHGTNRRQIRRVLARLTTHVETESGLASRYGEYVQRKGKNGYEIEHVWADKPERFKDEFPDESEFAEYRNRVGGLLLLPKSFNASYGALPYADKVEHYNGQNLLARSLHKACYDRNPAFIRFIEREKLPFRPHSEFRRADLEARQELYRQLAERVWSPQRLAREAETHG